jgi:radical SAM protein with 4Fe4S-binding SPASM domain
MRTDSVFLPIIDSPAIVPARLRPSGAFEPAPGADDEMKKRWRLRLPDLGIGKEVSWPQLLKSLTRRRVWNAGKVLVSFLLSAITKKHIVWGVAPILTIEPTNVCNLRCPLCVTGNGSMERPNGRMDFSTYRRLIDELGGRVIYLVLYNQGEPYINRHFNEFVAYAKQRGLYVTTSSNAHYFDPPTAEAAVASGLDTIIISVDGATQETYSHYRVGGSLQKVLEGTRNLIAAKNRLKSKTPHIYLQVIVMKHNEHELAAMEKLAAELGVDRLLKKTVQVETFEEAQEWLPSEERFRRYHLTEQAFVVKHGGKGACPRPWLTTMVNWDGTVVPCCFDKNGHHTAGDLRHESFGAIWQSETYTGFRQTLLTNRQAIDICRNCNEGIGLFI